MPWPATVRTSVATIVPLTGLAVAAAEERCDSTVDARLSEVNMSSGRGARQPRIRELVVDPRPVSYPGFDRSPSARRHGRDLQVTAHPFRLQVALGAPSDAV